MLGIRLGDPRYDCRRHAGASLEGTGLVVGFGVYIALSLVFWAAFWYYRDEFR
jgi:hypothetical protein